MPREGVTKNKKWHSARKQLLYDGKPVTLEELKKLCPFSMWLYTDHPALKKDARLSPGAYWMFPG